jgi:hypothetical protein
MKIFPVFLYFFSFVTLAQTPDPPLTYGKVSIEELQMKTYPQDSTAEALVLADYAQSRYDFNDPLRIFTERIVRIKILKRTGFKHATAFIHLYQKDDSFDYLENIEGATYNYENGKKVTHQLDPKSVFDTKEANNWHEVKFTFPQVQEGSVIEYRYTVSSTRWYNIDNWNFQASIPTLWSEYRILIPAYFDFKMTFQSYQPLAVKELVEGKSAFMRSNIDDPYISYRFAMKDVPALPEGEPYITTLEDYRFKINFELARTFFPQTGERKYTVSYQDMTQTLLDTDGFGSALKKFKKTAEKLVEGSKNTSDTLQNIKAAVELIKKKMRWNNESRVFAEENNLAKTLEKGIGNSADINLMLVSLLRAMGYDAHPVILSTRSHGKINTEIALLNRFNYVVAHLVVKGQDMLLDATDQYVALGTLPKRCLNKQGWLVHPSKARLVSLLPKENHGKYIDLTMVIGENQQIKGSVNMSYIGYAATDFREEAFGTGQEKFLENYKKKLITWQDPKVSLENLGDLQEPVKISLEGTINEAYSQAGDKIYLQPLMGYGLQTNPFKVQNRTYPIDIGYGTTETYKFSYTIPDGYVVEELPANMAVSLVESANRFLFNITQEGNKLIVSHKVVLKKTLFEPDNYPALKEFYDKIVSKHAEQIVLKKK